MHSELLLLQHIQILMKTISFSISYGNFCMCTKHFASHCRMLKDQRIGFLLEFISKCLRFIFNFFVFEVLIGN